MLKKLFFSLFLTLLVIIIISYSLLYFYQEKLIFHPDKIDKSFEYKFDGKLEELQFEMNDGKKLNGVLFRADTSKGLIFYLHGNAGSIETWGEISSYYTKLNYNVFMLDYRGFGKSEGEIESEKQFFDDIENVYNTFTKSYDESRIIILGYSIGSGPAAYLTSINHPKLLILQAPYYSLTDLTKNIFPLVPSFMLKYKFETYKYIKNLKTPIIIFHGDKDEVIYYGSSLKLKKEFKDSDRLITLKDQFHNGITTNPAYLEEISKILE